MQVQLAGTHKKPSAQSIELSDVVFACEFNEPLIHQVVVACQAQTRAGTRAQKTRSEVSGGGKKPWRQKGTGRARAGSIRSPLWRKGGVIFAAKPQDHSQKVNRKMYRGAMRSILSELIRQDRLHVVESFEVAEPKTKVLLTKLKEHNLENVLLLTDTDQINLYLAARNLKNTLALDVQEVDPLSLLRFEHVLTTTSALKKLEEMLAS